MSLTERAPSAANPGWLYAGLAVFVAVLWLAILPARPLFNPDEGRYAEIPREMLSGGDWVVPHLDGLAYIEKPPLQYWATAASLYAFGNSVFAARLYTALCALATLILVWTTAARLWGSAAAWQAAAVLGGMLLFVVLGQLLTLDMSLTFYMTAALAGFLLAQPPARGALGWMLLAWVATALGVLTKGLVAAAIPAAVLICYSLYARDFSPWRRLHLWRGVPLFLAIAVPWHWLAARRLPDFLQFFFVHEHLSRYLTPSADRAEAWWFFAAVFAAGSIPWTLSALRVVALGWRRRPPRGGFDPALFLWVWVVFICVFFSVSDSKLIPYILPAMPAVALLIGASPAAALRREVGFAALFTVLAGVALLAASWYGPRFIASTERGQYFSLLARPLAQIAALLVVSGLYVLLRRRDTTRVAVFLGAGWCLAGLLLMRGAAAVTPVYSGVALARALEHVPRDTPVFSVGTYDQTVPFYTQRTVTLAAYRGELDFGLRHDPGAAIASVDDFVAQWNRLSDGYAVMERGLFEALRSRGVPLREVARDVHRVVAARQTALLPAVTAP